MGGRKEIGRPQTNARVSNVNAQPCFTHGSMTTTRHEPPLVHRKIAVLGFRATGKTSLTHAFIIGTFGEKYHPTVEITYHKTIGFRRIKFDTAIVDTAGMDQFSRVSRNASVGVHGYVLVFSLTSRQSFEGIQQVNEALRSTLGDAPGVRIPRVLVGSMLDLVDQRDVSRREAQAIADLWGAPYVEFSSKTGENVAEVFHTLIREIERDEGFLNEQETNDCIIL